MNTTIDKDLQELSKKLYLESPDLWIDFSSKIDDKIIDEMVLFFAIKHNLPSIVEFAIENNKLDLDKPSKNNNYSSIRAHLITASKQYNRDEVLNLLDATLKNDNTISSEVSNLETSEKHSESLPKYTCIHCKCNIFDLGYKVIGNTVHRFSSSENKLIEVPINSSKQVVCNNCNTVLANTTLEILENICKVQSCNNCGKDLTKVGIFDTSRLEYDDTNNVFISKSTSYYCGNCKAELDENQKSYFNL